MPSSPQHALFYRIAAVYKYYLSEALLHARHIETGQVHIRTIFVYFTMLQRATIRTHGEDAPVSTSSGTTVHDRSCQWLTPLCVTQCVGTYVAQRAWRAPSYVSLYDLLMMSFVSYWIICSWLKISELFPAYYHTAHMVKTLHSRQAIIFIVI